MAGLYLTSVVLEFAEEDLSDITPTWVDVTSDCMGIEWWAGIQREGDDPTPGGATIRMKNTNRRWEPDYTAGMFSPNITAHRRFRLTLDDAAGAAVQEFLVYVTDIEIDYPAGTGYSEVTFTCADGSEVLALDDLPSLDPPDAESYEDVVNADEPWGYWRLGEPEGTRAQARIIRRIMGKGKNRRKLKIRRGTRYSTREEVGAVSGPAGTYKSTPALGQEGLVVGDPDTSVLFTAAGSEWVRVALEDGEDLDGANLQALTLEALVKPATTPGANYYTIVGGYRVTAGVIPRFMLRIETGADKFEFGMVDGLQNLVVATGTTTAVAGTAYHLVGAWDGNNMRLYVNGVLEATTGQPNGAINSSGNHLSIGAASGASTSFFFDGHIDEVSIYEHALTAERALAHYQAARLRGFPEETAAQRVEQITDTALWGVTTHAGTRTVAPVMQHGQPRLEELAETVHAEGARAMFFFNGSGTPLYLGHEWQSTSSSYNTTQATLGDQAGEVGYQGIELEYDNEVYNEVTASHEGGVAYTTGPGTPPPRRAHTEFTDLILSEQNHVESLAEATLAFYGEPQHRPASVTLNGADAQRLNHILRRDIGHQIRVKKSGLSGARIDRITNIIGKRKTLTPDKHLVCTWTLARGFNATEGVWRAGIVGFSEAGSTTIAA